MPSSKVISRMLVATLLIVSVTLVHAASLRVMTFNIWVGGESGKQPIEQTVEVIKAARADVVGLQESHGHERDGVRPDSAAVIADQLGWHYFDQGDDDTGIISRYKL